MEQIIILFIVFVTFIFVTLIYNLFSSKDDYKYLYYRGYSGYSPNVCENNPDCLWDVARTVTLKDGSPGVCVLGGKACPSFM